MNPDGVTTGQEIAVSDLDGLVFTPAENWNGPTSFTWNGKDGSGYAATDATVTITLNPVNDPPTISGTPLIDVTVDEEAANSTIDLSSGFSDVDIATNGDPRTYTTSSSNPDLVSAAVDGANLILSYQPNKNGTAAFADIPDEITGISRDVGLGQSQTPGAVQTKVSHVCLRNERICYPIKG